MKPAYLPEINWSDTVKWQPRPSLLERVRRVLMGWAKP